MHESDTSLFRLGMHGHVWCAFSVSSRFDWSFPEQDEPRARAQVGSSLLNSICHAVYFRSCRECLPWGENPLPGGVKPDCRGPLWRGLSPWVGGQNPAHASPLRFFKQSVSPCWRHETIKELSKPSDKGFIAPNVLSQVYLPHTVKLAVNKAARTTSPNGEGDGERLEKTAEEARNRRSRRTNGEWANVTTALAQRYLRRQKKSPLDDSRRLKEDSDGARNRIRTCDLYRVKIAF